MSAWNHDGSRVHNAVAPLAWASLDLKLIAGGGSTTHPSARTMALLKIENSAGWPYMAFRPGGAAFTTYVNQTLGHGSVVITPNSATGDAALVLVPTSATGTVEWQSQTASATEIWLVGFIEGTDSGQTVFSAAMPSTWTDLDLTQDLGAAPTGVTAEALVYLWYLRSGGTSNEIATRPNGGSSNFLGSGVLGGCSQGAPFAVADTEAYVGKTDGSGIIEHRGDTVVPNATVLLESFEETNFDDFDVEVYAAAAPPLGWQALDLSAHVGLRRSLVLIQVHLENAAPGGLQATAFQPTGDAGDYLPGSVAYPMGVACCGLDAGDRTLCLCETNASGVLNWISSGVLRDTDLRLMGAFRANDPPVISSEAPTGVAVAPDANISFTTSDDAQVIQNTIDLTLTPPGLPADPVIVNGVFQGFYTGTVVANGTNGFDVTVDPVPMIVGAWTAVAYCEDVYGASDTAPWGWTVIADPPTISNQFPTGSVLDLSSIRFTLLDDYGLYIPTLEIRAIPAAGTPLVVYTGAAFQTGWGGIVVETGVIYWTEPTRVDVTINTWPDDFEESSPRRWTLEVAITSIADVEI